MNKTMLMMVASTLLTGSAGAAPTGADLFGQKTTELFTAMKAKDAAALDGMLLPNFISTVFTGANINKQAYIETTVKHLAIEEFKLIPVAVHEYGDATVVIYHVALKATADGQPWNPVLTSTDTWIKQGATWKLAARHSSAVMQARPAK